MKSMTRAYSTRKGPLYHNCQLRAPDDEPLCICDPKKARWYVEKGLGELVTEDPLVVRLNFEPSGRPQVERDDGRFYLQERHNICVTCGKDQSYIRKNVVPHEYRKHFPDILKDHQSHDVVLLCVECHQTSNLHDQVFRHKLSKEFSAPIGTEQDVKVSIDTSRKIIRNAASALIRNKENIPEKRVAELEKIVKDYFQVEHLSEQQLLDVSKMDVQIWNDAYQAHGHKVYEAYEKIGVMKLEQRWREHFLSAMNPQHMPDGWSITHNVYKMQLKGSHFPPGHPERLKYKIALVGTEGDFDIPYNPPPTKRDSISSSSSTSQSRELTPENRSSPLGDEVHCVNGGC